MISVEYNFFESTLGTWRGCLSGNSSRYHFSNLRMNFFQSSEKATTIKQFSIYLEGGSGLQVLEPKKVRGASQKSQRVDNFVKRGDGGVGLGDGSNQLTFFF